MESDRTDPPLTAADLDEIDAKLKPCTDPPFEVIGTRVSCGISRRGREIVVRADEHDIDDLEALAVLRNNATPLLALARRGLEAEAQYERGYEQGIKERVAEVVRTERERDVLYDATRLSVIGMEVVRAAARMASDKDARVLLKANIDASDRLAAALAEVERMRGQLACAKRFDLPCGAEVYMSKKDNANTYLLWARGDFSDARYNTLDAAWSAAEQAQAGQAAKQGGEGDSHEAR